MLTSPAGQAALTFPANALFFCKDVVFVQQKQDCIPDESRSTYSPVNVLLCGGIKEVVLVFSV